MADTRALPGADLVEAGLRDLRAGRRSDEALLVAIGSPRLRRLGFAVTEVVLEQPAEHLLYLSLAERHGTAAHGRYLALIRRLVSFERAAEHQLWRRRRLGLEEWVAPAW